MRDRELQRIYVALDLGWEAYNDYIESGANESYQKDLRKISTAMRLVQKDRARLAKRRKQNT